MNKKSSKVKSSYWKDNPELVYRETPKSRSKYDGPVGTTEAKKRNVKSH